MEVLDDPNAVELLRGDPRRTFGPVTLASDQERLKAGGGRSTIIAEGREEGDQGVRKGYTHTKAKQ